MLAASGAALAELLGPEVASYWARFKDPGASPTWAVVILLD